MDYAPHTVSIRSLHEPGSGGPRGKAVDEPRRRAPAEGLQGGTDPVQGLLDSCSGQEARGHRLRRCGIVWSFPPTMPGMKAREFWSQYAKEQPEWEEKLGRPPASFMERQLGEWAEALM